MQLDHPKILRQITICLLTTVCVVNIAASSGPFATWTHVWQIEVNGEHCRLYKEYKNPAYRMFMEAVQADPALLANRQPPSKGALDGTIYDRLIGGFIVNLQKRGYTFPPDFYRQISFYLFLYPENMASPEDNLSESTAQTESITVNGSEMHKVNEYTYWLALDETREVFDAHVLDRRIDIDLELDNGESRSVEMSAFPRGQFKIWAEILNTCERESPG